MVIKHVQSKYTLSKMLINEDSHLVFFIPSRFPLRSRIKKTDLMADDIEARSVEVRGHDVVTRRR